MKIKNVEIGLRGHDLGNSFEEMLDNAVKNNVTNIQLAMPRTLSQYDFYKIGYDEKISNEVKKSLDDNGLRLSVLSCYINPVEHDEKILERDLTLFENFIRYAKKFNADVIGTETGFYQSVELTQSEDNYQFFLKNFRRLVKVAEDNDVIIGIELVHFFTIYSAEVMLRLLNDINSDNVAVIFDLSNVITMENYGRQHEIIDSVFELLRDKIRIIHLKDFKIKNNKKEFALVGTGDYDIKYLFTKIEELKHKPDIILDETPFTEYKNSICNINSILN